MGLFGSGAFSPGAISSAANIVNGGDDGQQEDDPITALLKRHRQQQEQQNQMARNLSMQIGMMNPQGGSLMPFLQGGGLMNSFGG